MNPKSFKNTQIGKCVKTLKNYWAFIPNPLPFNIKYEEDLIYSLSKADRLMGDLSGTGRLLANPYLLIRPYIRKEAVSSSRIEGTQASLGDLFFFEAEEPKQPKIPDVREVINYVKAMEYGLERLKELPISIRLIKEIHDILLEGVRGKHLTPGELRRTQNWIGPPGCMLNKAVFVPPPVFEMNHVLNLWEKYLHSKTKESPLIQCALMHYQFEAIHPFLDGNGRIGRLLITFYLCEREHLSQPLLYLSEFFEKYRDEYYRRLLNVSQKGDLEGWLKFFLRGIAIQSNDAIVTANHIIKLHQDFINRLHTKRIKSEITYRLIDEIFLSPVLSIAKLSRSWNINYNTIKRGVLTLIKHKILLEATNKIRHKLYISPALMKILIKA